MKKEKQIDYLNRIRPFLNLKAVCEDYNRHNNCSIDYNNLRAVLNGVSKTRLSEERLESFVDYLYAHLYTNVFDAYSSVRIINAGKISYIVNECASRMSEEIIREISNEIQYK